jgi:hypothetical protein
VSSADSVDLAFAVVLGFRCNESCPAIQEAIDRLAAACGNDRARLLDSLRRGLGLDATGAARLSMLLLEAWKASDVLLATGRSCDFWLALLDEASNRRTPS